MGKTVGRTLRECFGRQQQAQNTREWLCPFHVHTSAVKPEQSSATSQPFANVAAITAKSLAGTFSEPSAVGNWLVGGAPRGNNILGAFPVCRCRRGYGPRRRQERAAVC